MQWSSTKKHPNLFEVIKLTKQEQAATAMQIIQLAGSGQPWPKKHKMQRREDKVKKLTSDFDNGHLTIQSFISSLAHLVINLHYLTILHHIYYWKCDQVLIVQKLDQMELFHILLDYMGLDQMGLDEVGRPSNWGGLVLPSQMPCTIILTYLKISNLQSLVYFFSFLLSISALPCIWLLFMATGM